MNPPWKSLLGITFFQNSLCIIALRKVTLASSPNYNDTSVSNGRSYNYQIGASSSVGDGGFSDIASIIPIAPSSPPPLPTANTMTYLAIGVLVIVAALMMALFLILRR